MHIKKFIPFLIFPLLTLPSCSESNSQGYFVISAKDNDIITTNIRVESHTKNMVEVSCSYSDKYFVKNDSDDLNVSLALASLSICNIASYYKYNKSGISVFGYQDEEYISTDDGSDETFDEMDFAIGHKAIDGKEMIAIGLCGEKYEEQWVSNFNIGESGDHKGFSISAKGVLVEIKNYINKYNLSNYAMWISGYSRSAAVSALLGKYVYNDETLNIDKNDLYVYTFESPKCAIDDGNEYPFIRNIVNKYDFIQYNFAYDFIRIGHDYVINDYADEDLMRSYCKTLEPSYEVPVFHPKKLSLSSDGFLVNDYNSKMTFDTFIVQLMKMVYLDTSELENKEQYIDVSTRAKYCENIQFSLSYIVYILLHVSDENIALIVNYFSEDNSRIFDLINNLTKNAESFYLTLKDIFDVGKIDYDDDSLRKVGEQLSPALQTLIALGGNSALKTIYTFIGNGEFIAFSHKTICVRGYLNSLEAK